MSEQASLRRFFKVMNKFMLLMWRLGLGPWINFWPAVVGRIMVITHTGRKSGLRRQTPVNYTIVDGDVYCIAGFHASDWYRNLKANPHVEVWLPDGRWSAVAEEVPNDAAHLPIMRQLLLDTGFATPLFGGFNPRALSDPDLQTATADYCLIRMHREESLG
jgi:deazaflavin-dependent oxidoreductase (nitroreductase family)